MLRGETILKVSQITLDLKLIFRCKRCGRKISHPGFGKDCERKIIAEFKSSFPEKYHQVIRKYLTKVGLKWIY
jgi:hypothetical protein